MNTLAQLSNIEIFFIVLFGMAMMTILVSAFFHGSKNPIDEDLITYDRAQEKNHAEIVAAQNHADGIVPPPK